jgi:SAM-dependent methyltransferase
MEHIPFKDNSFDLVFSGYTLQYVNNKPLGLNEIKRVVKKGGSVVIVVPNFTERIYSFFHYYIYFLVKILRLVFSKINKNKNIPTVASNDNLFNMAKFKQNYRTFPFFGPDGAYKNACEEMFKHLPYIWNKGFRDSGFRLVSSSTTAFVPYPLLLTISPNAAHFLLSLFKKFTRFFGSKPFIKYLGFNYCAVLKKEEYA